MFRERFLKITEFGFIFGKSYAVVLVWWCFGVGAYTFATICVSLFGLIARVSLFGVIARVVLFGVSQLT